MKIIAGLGNPETMYQLTRHNIGFLLIERIAKQLQASWQEKPKFKAIAAEAYISGEKVLLVKPSTYYNLSGESLRAIIDFYKLSSDNVLVLHDELALPFGTLRTRLDGSDAGNNGIKNIISHIGEDFARIRVGIANQHTSERDAAGFVLGRLNEAELVAMENIANHTLAFMQDFVHEDKKFSHTSVRIQSDQP